MKAPSPKESANQADSETFVGRQPIFDRDMNVVAYELLFRRQGAEQANVIDQDLATTQVIVNAFMEIGIDNLVGDKVAYINMPTAFLVGDYPIPFPQQKVVLEVLEHVDASADVIAALRKLSMAGYAIALDDFEYSERVKPLLSHAQIVKLDVMNVAPDEVRRRVEQLVAHRVKLVAEKIETQEMFELCKRLGFQYFQGYFLCKPNVVKTAKLPANRLQLLKLLGELNDPNIQFSELEKTIVSDVGLSYKLLRVINSARYSLRQKVESLRHALVLLGIKQIKEWATLVTLTSVENKPYELFINSLQRAKHCQLLALERGATNVDAYFTVGLFSTLEALLDKPYAEILPQLSLADELHQALLERRGHMGEMLAAVIAYEQGDWSHVQVPNVSTLQLRSTYLSAVQWARDAAQALSAK